MNYLRFNKTKFLLMAVTFLVSGFFIFNANTGQASAATITSAQTGNWNADATWVGGVQPGVTDNVVIADGHTVTVTASASILGVTINDGGSLVLNNAFTNSGSTTIGNGTSGSLSITSTTGTKIFRGLVTINAGATWDNTLVTEPVIFSGGLVNNGTFDAGAGLYTFDTNALQSISGTVSISNLTVTGVVLTNNGTLTVSADLDGTGQLVNSSTGVLNIGAINTIATLTATAAGNIVNYTGAAQTVKATTYDNLTLSGTLAKTFPAGTTTVNNVLSRESTSSVTLTGSLAYGPNATLQYKGSAAQTTGNEFTSPFTATGGVIIDNSNGVDLTAIKTINSKLTLTSGVFTLTNALTMGDGATIERGDGSLSTTPTFGDSVNVAYVGASGAITTDVELPTVASVLNDLTINNTDGVNLNANATINGTLTLTDGIVSTGGNTLTLGSSGSISGASADSYIDGTMARAYAGIGAKTFPIGMGGNYRPITLNYTDLDSPSVVTVSQTESAMDGDLPGGAELFPDRYWTIFQAGGSDFTYDLTLDGTGFTPTGDEAQVVILKNDGSVVAYGTTYSDPYYTATGLTGFSDFALGEDNVISTITAVDTAHEDGTFKAGEVIDLTVEYSEIVNVSGTPTLSLNSGGTASYLSGSGTDTLTFRYTVLATENNINLTYTDIDALALAGGTIKDVAGNDTDNELPVPTVFQGEHAIVIDTAAPTLSPVSIESTNTMTDLAKLGETVTITFTSNEAIQEPSVTIGAGAATVSGGPTAWTASRVMTGDDVDGTITFSITFSDIVGNAGVAVTATTDDSTVLFDKTRPSSEADSVASTNAAPISVSFTTDDGAGSGIDTIRLWYRYGTSGDFSPYAIQIASTPFSFTPTDGDGIYQFYTITTDNAGNSELAPGGDGYDTQTVYDTTAPTVGIVVADSSLKAGETSLVTFTFSEPVTGFTNDDLTIANGTLTDVASADGGTTWTATFTPTADIIQPTNVITINKAGVVDSVGNIGVGSTDSNNYAINTLRPTVSVALDDSALSADETAIITFTFSSAPTDFTADDVAVGSGAISDLVVDGENSLVYTAIFTPTVDTEDNSNVVTVGTGWTDAAGNAPVGSTNSANYTVDTLRPTVGIVVADDALKAGESSIVTFTFSEPVTGFTNSDLTIANGTLTAVASADGGTTWTATFTPTANIAVATNIITINKAGIADIAGNVGAGSTDSNNYAIDTILPTVNIVITDPILSFNQTTAVTFIFSEVPTDFTADDITAGNGAISDFTVTGDSKIYTATFTPTASTEDDTNLITVGIDWTDPAGNAPTGSTNSDNYTVDTLKPSLVLSSATVDPVSGLIAVTAEFSENVTGFDSGDISVTNGAVENFLATDGNTYTFDVNPDDGASVAVTIQVLADKAVDAVGNNNTASNVLAYTSDTILPTVTIVLTDPALSFGETTIVTFTFSEAPTDFTADDITAGSGVISGLVVDGGNPLIYTATFTPAANTEDDTNVITVGTGWTDPAGNAPTGSTNSDNYTVDTLKPSLVLSSATVDPVSGLISVTAEFSENVTGFDSGDISVTNGAVENFLATDGNTYTFDVNPDDGASVAVTIQVLADVAVDSATNNNTASNVLAYTSDTVAPTLNITAPLNASKNKASAVITFTNNSDSTPLSAECSIDNSNWTACTTGITTLDDITGFGDLDEGTFTLYLRDADLAGNVGTGSEADIVKDTTAPVLAVTTEVTTPDTDTTPDYSFTSDEVGTIVYGGPCSSDTTSAASGANTITFNALADGTYSNCAITVLDEAGNNSNTLTLAPFLIDTVAPVITNATPANGASTSDTTPTISAQFTETGSGINQSTASMTVDSIDVTNFTTVNSSGITYNPPTALSYGVHNLVVNVSDNVGQAATALSWQMAVVNDQTTLNLTTDNASVLADGVSQAKITATVLDPGGAPVTSGNVFFSKNIGSLTATSVDLNEQGQAIVYLTSAETGQATVTVNFTTDEGAIKTASVNVTFTATPKTISTITSADSVPADSITAATITATVLDISTPVSGANVTFSTTRGALSSAAATTNGSGQATVTITADSAGSGRITAYYNTGSEVISSYVDITFTAVDTTAPTATQYPANLTTSVAVNVHPYIDFSEAMNASTLTATNIKLKTYTGSVDVPATVAVSTNSNGSHRVTITPTSLLTTNTVYYFYIDNDVEDASGNNIATGSWYAGAKDSHKFTTKADVTSWDINLVTGWNLVSFPLIPNNTAIATVLSGVISNVNRVTYYDASTNAWLSYIPGTGGPLTTMEDGKGYWINMTAPAILTISGTELPAGNGDLLPLSYEVLSNKWNLMGFKSVDNEVASSYLGSASSGNVIWQYQNGQYSAVASSDNLQPGLGYWVYNNASTYTVVPTN